VQPIALTFAPSRPATPPALPHPAPEVLRAHGGSRNNGRYATAIGNGEWHTVWTAPAVGDAFPHAVLAHGFGAFVNADSAWLHYDRAHLSDRRRRATGDAEWDTTRNLVYTTDHDSQFIAVPIPSFGHGFHAALVGGSNSTRSFLHRVKDTFVVASIADKIGGGKMTTLETIEVNHEGSRRRGLLIETESGALLVAVHNEIIVAAYSNRVDFLDLNLQYLRRLSGVFEPRGLSIDEAGRVVMRVDGTLWQFTVRGECVATALPDGSPYLDSPPLIGYDHRAYVLGARRILEVSETGAPEWMYETADKITGAAITGDDRLLASIGSKLMRFTSDGRAATLREFPGETLLTAPAFNERGELLVMSNHALHCLWRG